METKTTSASASAPEGLYYRPNFITAEGAGALLRWVDAQDWDGALARRVQHYGARYDYALRRVADLSPETLPETSAETSAEILARPLPSALKPLAARVGQSGGFAPDQIIVNEYLPGQGIASHIDQPKAFGPVVATVSLGAPVLMEFSRNAAGERQRHAIWLAADSLLVLTGEARHRWRHGIARRKSDPQDGLRIPRSRHVSLTFRSLA